ncbi:SMI1/KNR4 family protein [bacterium CPR1]|nr:SMI1/KNR4 family protein [bacterium CPR1]
MSLAQLEERLGSPLPEPYRSFLLEDAPDYVAGWLNELYDAQTALRELDIHRRMSGFPPHLLPIGDDGLGNYVYLSLESADVWFVDHESDDGLTRQAESFPAFLR